MYLFSVDYFNVLLSGYCLDFHNNRISNLSILAVLMDFISGKPNRLMIKSRIIEIDGLYTHRSMLGGRSNIFKCQAPSPWKSALVTHIDINI